jgi:magnesium transporter
MINIYKTVAGKLKEQSKPTTGCWINAVGPDDDEIARLVKLGVPLEFIHSSLDVDELARVDSENGSRLVVFQVPYFVGDQADVPYNTMPLGIISTGKYIVTVCKQNNEILRESKKASTHPFHTKKHNSFILHILFNTAKLYLSYLAKINRIVDELEDRLQRSIRNSELLQLLKYQKSLTFFSTALKTNAVMVERLQRLQLFKKYPDDLELLEDVLTENRQAEEMTNIYSNILSQMMDAFASMISNNQNNVIKLLTSVTILMSLPAILGSLFGMNVALPLQDNPEAFWIIVGLSLVLAVIATIFFRKKDWF